ncbi:MAG: hypothetical protein U0O21_08900 [Lachnospiraceae bacterium]
MERYCLQSSCNVGSGVSFDAITSEKKIPAIEKRNEVKSVKNNPVVAARQASSVFCCPIFRDSSALSPTAVPTLTAIIRNWIE